LIPPKRSLFLKFSLVNSFKVNSEEVRSWALSSDGNLVAVGTTDHIIRVFDLKTKTLLHHFAPKEWEAYYPRSVDFLDSDQYLASSHDDGRVRIWDLRHNSLAKVIPIPTADFRQALSTHIRTDNRVGVTEFAYCPPSLFDIIAGKLIGLIDDKVHCYSGSPASGLSFSPDGTLIAGVDRERSLVIWDTKTRQQLRLYDFLRSLRWVVTL